MLCQTGWSKTSWDAQHGWSFGESCMRLLPTSVPEHPEKRDYADGGSEKEFLFSTFVEEWPQPYKEQIPLCSRGTRECGGWQRPRGGDWRLLVSPLWAHHIRGDGWMWGPLPACWAVWMSDTSLVGALCAWQRMPQWAALCRWEFATRVLCAHLCRLELPVLFTWNGFSYPRGKRTALYLLSQGASSFQMPFIVIHWSQWEMGM